MLKVSLNPSIKWHCIIKFYFGFESSKILPIFNWKKGHLARKEIYRLRLCHLSGIFDTKFTPSTSNKITIRVHPTLSLSLSLSQNKTKTIQKI